MTTLRYTIEVDKPISRVFAYLADFTTTNEWDPGTVSTVRRSGDGGIGTEYANTSTFMGRQTQLTYRVIDLVPNELIRLTADDNKSVKPIDTIEFFGDEQHTRVVYTAEFRFKGVRKVADPLMRLPLSRLGKAGERGMREALQRL